MNGTPAHSAPSALVRWALVFIAAVCSAAVLGASEARPARINAAITPRAAVQHPSPAARAGTELMQDVVAAATVASIDRHKKIMWLEVTAYCSCAKCCGPHAQGLTASGRSITYNGGQFVAGDKKLFKFGTRLSIPGYAGGQPVEVIDRGGAIKGYHIDVFFPTHEQAKQWGRQRLAVTIEE